MNQTLLVIRDGTVIVQTPEETYTETVGNFLADGGILPVSFDTIDYCPDTGSCLIDGEPQEVPPYAGNVIKNIDVFLAKKAIRDKAAEDERIASDFARQDREAEQAEEARRASLTLEEVKTEKLTALKAAFEDAAENAHCTSSLGFEIDANDTANRNVASLIRRLINGSIETATFRDYNNQYHPGLTLTDINTIQSEIDANGSRLYDIKWHYEQQIEQAETIEAVNAISFSF